MFTYIVLNLYEHTETPSEVFKAFSASLSLAKKKDIGFIKFNQAHVKNYDFVTLFDALESKNEAAGRERNHLVLCKIPAEYASVIALKFSELVKMWIAVSTEHFLKPDETYFIHQIVKCKSKALRNVEPEKSIFDNAITELEALTAKRRDVLTAT
jgi:hypothetical protein